MLNRVVGLESEVDERHERHEACQHWSALSSDCKKVHNVASSDASGGPCRVFNDDVLATGTPHISSLPRDPLLCLVLPAHFVLSFVRSAPMPFCFR